MKYFFCAKFSSVLCSEARLGNMFDVRSLSIVARCRYVTVTPSLHPPPPSPPPSATPNFPLRPECSVLPSPDSLSSLSCRVFSVSIMAAKSPWILCSDWVLCEQSDDYHGGSRGGSGWPQWETNNNKTSIVDKQSPQEKQKEPGRVRVLWENGVLLCEFINTTLCPAQHTMVLTLLGPDNAGFRL